jgi:hypothetical protein
MTFCQLTVYSNAILPSAILPSAILFSYFYQSGKKFRMGSLSKYELLGNNIGQNSTDLQIS